MRKIRSLFCTLALLAFLAPGSLAHAAPDAEGFTPVQPGEQLVAGESIPARNLVGGAYGFIFAALALWTLTVQLRSRRVEAELDALRAKIAR